jgi:hypothetical protein
MLLIEKAQHTKGLLIKGDFWDFDRLYYAISKFTGDFGLHHGCCFPGYESAAENLLGLNYDLRHAWQGDRELVEVYNGVHDEWFDGIDYENDADENDEAENHNDIHYAIFRRKELPNITERNAYFCINMNFPEAIYYALITTKLLEMKQLFYSAVEAAVANNAPFEVYSKDYQLFGAEEDIYRVSHFAKLTLHALYLFVGEKNYNLIMSAYKKNDGFFSTYDSEPLCDILYDYYQKDDEDDNPTGLTTTLISLFEQ